MIKQFKANAEKFVLLSTNAEERWRLRLLRNKLAYVVKSRGTVAISSPEVDLAALADTATTHHQALDLVVRKLWRAKRSAEAIELVEQVWEERGRSSGQFALACAKVWYRYGKVRQGDEALAVARVLMPDCAEVYVIEAEGHAKRGNIHRAISAGEDALRLAKDNREKVYWSRFLGRENFKLQHFDKSVEHYSNAEIRKSSWRQQYEYAIALGEVGQLRESRDALRTAASSAVPKSKPGYEIAELHFKAERHQLMLSELELTPPTHERFRLQARAMLTLGQFEECAEACAKAHQTPRIMEYRALALELLGRDREALETYRELFEVELSSARRSLVAHRLARTAFRLGEYEILNEAEISILPTFDSLHGLAAEVHPDFEVLAEDARAAWQRGNVDRALSVLRRMELSASSWANVSRINRAIGLLAHGAGDTRGAAVAFFKANPFPQPNTGEANASSRGLEPTERYSEFSRTASLSSDVVVYESFHGGKTACNPLALCLELLANPDYAHLQHVWVLQSGAPIHRELLGRENVHFVRHQSVGYMLRVATARTLVNNSTFPRWFVRRDGQRYANTWHGVPWKRMGREITGDSFAYDNVARNFLQASDLVFPNQYTGEKLLVSQDVAGLVGDSWQVCGSPRIDRMLRQSEDDQRNLRLRIGIPDAAPVIFYAPTWRGTMQNRSASQQDVFDAVSELAGLGATVLLRTHYYSDSAASQAALPRNVFVPDETIDSNELLAIADVLVTDYSSILFDFAALKRPIVNYVYDLEAYIRERGLYFDVDKIPGRIARNRGELSLVVAEALRDRAVVQDWSELPTQDLWAAEDGHASDRVIQLLFEQEQKSKPVANRVLVSMNSLNANGITRSLINLATSAAEEVGHMQVMVPVGALNAASSVELANGLRSWVDYTLRTRPHVGTRQENLAWNKLKPLLESYPEGLQRFVKERMQSEYCRLFGDVKFSAVVDFDGYDLFAAALLAYGPSSDVKRIYVGHNEFAAEMHMKFPAHRSIGHVLEGFSGIAAVSEAVKDANARETHKLFGVPTDLHAVLPNTLNVAEINAKSKEKLDPDLEEWFTRPQKHLLMIGRLSPEKNHEMAIDALKSARDGGLEVDLLILGDGPLRADLEMQVRRIGLGDSVFFAGQRPNPYPSLEKADGLLLSSVHEGQPMVFLEAMTLGTPIAATDIPASISTLENGRHGLIVPLDREGITNGIVALASSSVAPATFDSSAYLEASVKRFVEMVGLQSHR